MYCNSWCLTCKSVVQYETFTPTKIEAITCPRCNAKLPVVSVRRDRLQGTLLSEFGWHKPKQTKEYKEKGR